MRFDSSISVDVVNNLCLTNGRGECLWREPTSEDYLYSANERIRYGGINEYDFHARSYHASLPRFDKQDRLNEKYPWLSPYAYCAGNPVNLIDRNGERPKADEAAMMAACVYEDEDSQQILAQLEEKGWRKSECPKNIEPNSQNGLQSALFERTVDGVTEYAYVYAGTNSVRDACEDIAQIAGVSSQYHTAIENARTLSSELGNSELTFVGHSLGGGEAIASSMATGRAAITFNAAAVSKLTKFFECLVETPDVVNYLAVGTKVGNIRIGGDMLNNLQEKVGLSLPGKAIKINTGIIPTHTINDFLKRKLPER